MKIIKEESTLKLEASDIEYLSHSNYVKCKDIDFGIYNNENRKIGELKLYNFRPSNGNSYVSIYIIKHFRGKKYGLKALEYILKYAKENLRLHRLTAEIYDYNLASINLFKKLGFEPEGKIKEGKYIGGKYHDILIFGKIL